MSFLYKRCGRDNVKTYYVNNDQQMCAVYMEGGTLAEALTSYRCTEL